ncbi:hypothetical protein [Comamonas sp. MYb396]|uniref:hypothetical protein n=1 Tax=Comamonas sp. MYb396 TaxID=2745302 RepID=UPI0030998DB0
MLLVGTVSALVTDPEYDDMSHVSVRDFTSGYWFSISRISEFADPEVMVKDQLSHRGGVIAVELHSQSFRATLSEAAATALDGHREYVVEFPASQYVSVRAALEAIFHGANSLHILG